MINRFHGGNIWQYPESLRSTMIDFSVNVNPLGVREKIKNIIVKNINKVNCYPDPESGRLKNILAKWHRLSVNNLLIGNGSVELIHLIPRALSAKIVLIPVPVFSEYEFAAKCNNAKCIFVKSAEEDNFKINIPKLLKSIPKADLVFLCNPNNPAGFILARREILSLLKACENYNTVLAIDEAFMDFVPHSDEITMILESSKNKNILVLRSLTKFFAIPGIRAGYITGHKEIIKKLARHTYPWNVNILAQKVSEKIIGDKEYIVRVKNIIAKESVYLHNNLNDIKGIKAYPSDANYFLCKLKNTKINNAAGLTKKLIRHGILIRNCNNFRGLNNKFFRIAVREREDNIKLLSVLKAVLG